jgi:hypothetical protein
MSDFFRDPTKPVARKQHRCTGCAHPIVAGEQYERQTGVFDGEWFCNTLHLECADTLREYGDGEFLQGELDPPERLKPAAQAPASAHAAPGGQQERPG